MPETPSQTPPRLASTSETDYAPISWTAVASLAVAGLYSLILVVLFVFVRRGQPLIELWLLALPILAVVLAFVARRQIQASEGTRTGERYANLGWWIGVLGGIGYVMYLAGVDYAIRRDAQQQFQAWADNLTDLDLTAANDPKFYTALYQTLPPGARAGLNPKDPAAFAKVAGLEAAGFRQMDIVRLCGRNRGHVQVRPNGLRDWQQKPTEITATLTATVFTPEGEHGLVVPMRAIVDENKARRWQFIPTQDGYVKTATLTRYGWQVAAIEADARRFVQEFLGRSSTPDRGVFAFLGYVQPGTDPQSAAATLSAAIRQADPRAALAGNLARPEVSLPVPPDWKSYLMDRVFALPGGAKAPPEIAQRLLAYWMMGGRLIPAGTINRTNPDQNPILLLPSDGGPGTVEMRYPIEVGVGDTSGSPTVARGTVVIQVPQGQAGPLLAELATGRAAGSGAPKANTPPADLQTLTRLPWRVVRLESDLKPLPSPAQAGPGGG